METHTFIAASGRFGQARGCDEPYYPVLYRETNAMSVAFKVEDEEKLQQLIYSFLRYKPSPRTHRGYYILMRVKEARVG